MKYELARRVGPILLMCGVCVGHAQSMLDRHPAAKSTKDVSGAPGLPVLWRDPGVVEELDFVGGPGGGQNAPKPPFRFIEENLSGSSPKVKVVDSDGVHWTAKFGSEARPETFATRLAWAVGYFVEPAYFLKAGKIDGIPPHVLKRAAKYVADDGSFTDARFEVKEKGVKKLEDEKSWRWDKNPFAGTRELHGLMVMVMLVSNFDNKDARDVARGSNTAIFLYPTGTGTEARYLVTDWGESMGRWGGYFDRERWKCQDYFEQTRKWILGVDDGIVRWGWRGNHIHDMTRHIRVSDVQWLMQYLGRVTDDQLRNGLEASGASPRDADCFANSVRARITELHDLSQRAR